MFTLTKATQSAGLLSAAALLCSAGIPPAALANHNSSNNSANNCVNGRYLGTYALQAERNAKFVQEDGSKLKATKDSQPSSNNDFGSFEVYSLQGMYRATDRTIALRSTRNHQWWRVQNDKSIKLTSSECRSDRDSTTFESFKNGDRLSLQSRKNWKWIKVKNNGKLKAQSDNYSSNSTFRLIQLDQATNPDPGPSESSTPEIDGWWIADNGRTFYITTQGSSVTMRGFRPDGEPLSISTGLLNGSLFNGNWSNHCYGARGTFAFNYTNGALEEIGGNLSVGTSGLFRTLHPSNVNLSAQPSCDSGNGNGNQQSQGTQQELKLTKKYKLVIKKDGRTNSYEWEKPAKTLSMQRPETSSSLHSFYPENRPTVNCKGGIRIEDFDSVKLKQDGTASLTRKVKLSNKCGTSGRTTLAKRSDYGFVKAEPGKNKTRSNNITIDRGEYRGSYLRITYFLNNKEI
jgi:hypothetical protein